MAADRVSILTSALADRRGELEQATIKLAEHSALLEQATAELGSSNGDFGIWQAIDQRVRFETRQVERYQGIVQQCSENVRCSETALANAKCEAEIEELQRLEARQAEIDRKALSKAAGLYREACALLASVQPSVELAKQRADQLSRLGVTRSPRHPIYQLWLALIEANPGAGPAYWNDATKFERDLVGNIQNAMKLEPMPERQCLSLRQSWGDTTARELPPLPKIEPPKPVQTEDYRDGVTDRFWKGMPYRVEHWVIAPNVIAPNFRVEHRLVLSNSLPFGATIISDQLVTLEHGLTARFVRLDEGRELLLAPSKPLAERAGTVLSAMADEVRSLIGLNEEQPSL